MMETIVLRRKRFFAFLLALIMVLTMFPDAVLADGYTDTTGIVCEHTLEPHAAVSANCMEAGNTEYWECSKCHHCFTDEDGSNETPDASGFTIAALGSNQANGHDLRDDWAIAGNVGSDGKISGGENDGLFICKGDSEGMLTYERFCHRANCTYRETEKHGINAPHEFSVDFTWGELEQQYGCIATIFCSICGAEENTLFAAGNSQHYYDDPVHHRNGEFDVALEFGNQYQIYEAKYYKKPMALSEIHKEIRQVRDIESLNVVQLGFIAVNGFEKQEDGIHCYNGEDLYH